jgi:GNAT superfamily N-acetyltransferase
VRLLDAGDIKQITEEFAAAGINKPVSLYERYLAEQCRGERVVLVAFQEDVFGGSLTIKWASDYPPFKESGIPEIVDFNVLPQVRRQGVGSLLMDEAEQRIKTRSPIAGIGVGLYSNYGPAQRLYVKRGFVPDGRGVVWHNRHVPRGRASRRRRRPRAVLHKGSDCGSYADLAFSLRQRFLSARPVSPDSQR